MARMTGGEAIVDTLLRHGVDTVFGLPGVQTYGLFDALARQSNRIRLINARHEQGSAYMALGYAKGSGRPGVFTVVPGPGVLNAAAALCTAYGVNAPVICLTGQVPTAAFGLGRGALHELPDQLATLRSILKWAARIEHPAAAPEMVAQAFQQATCGRPGPVAVEMFWDHFGMPAEVAPAEPKPALPVPTPDPVALAAAVKLIAAAKKPMIFVGGGAADAGPEIRALAERMGVPVVGHRSGLGVLPASHPLSLSLAGGWSLWQDTDLLIGIGSRLEGPAFRWGGIRSGVATIRIDIDPVEMRRLRPDVFVLADAAEGAAALLAALGGEAVADRTAEVAASRDAFTAKVDAIQPHADYLRALRQLMPADSYVVDEVCQAGFTATFAYPIERPRGFVTSGYQGTLGSGFPIALGVKVANPNKPVVSLTGDGGFMFASSELATAVQHGIGLVTVLFNNSAYGNVLRDQRRLFEGRAHGSELRNPDFQKYADSFGVKSWRVNTTEGFASAMSAALTEKGPTIVEVMTDITTEASPWPLISPLRS
jgi:acetolactate synthase-1/2/3 large subunit